MLVLGIETATDVCTVGLTAASGDVSDLAILRPRQHGSRLSDLINAALLAADVSPADLDAVAVSAGPGSYTGLRIGVSTAKGLCFATQAVLVGVPTLQALAQASGARGLVVPLLPSRRGEVYAAAYEVSSDGSTEVSVPEAVAVDSLAAWAPEGALTLVGPAAGVGASELGERATRSPARASGLAIARIGRQRLLAGDIADLDAFEPAYLKPFVSGDPNARPLSGTASGA